jgi:hypothetical protein
LTQAMAVNPSIPADLMRNEIDWLPAVALPPTLEGTRIAPAGHARHYSSKSRPYLTIKELA